MSSTLSRLLLFAYPPSWRARYAMELGALLESGPFTFTVLWNVVTNGAAEWLRAGWRAPHRAGNARLLLALSAMSVGFIWVSTMTTLGYDRWLLLNSGFGLLLTATAFVRAMSAGWSNGFVTGATASWLFVAMLLSWVRAAGSRMVQLPFDHFDVLARGSIDRYLAGSGFREFAVAALLLAVLMTAVLALMAWAGATVGTLFKRLREAE
jgi:hypothetical protein